MEELETNGRGGAWGPAQQEAAAPGPREGRVLSEFGSWGCPRGAVTMMGGKVKGELESWGRQRTAGDAIHSRERRGEIPGLLSSSSLAQVAPTGRAF